MLQIWDIVNIIGIVFEIFGFIFLLRQVIGGLPKLIENQWDVFIKMIKSVGRMDLDSYDQSIVKKFVEEELPKDIEKRGILLVIAGLLIQIIAIIIQASL